MIDGWFHTGSFSWSCDDVYIYIVLHYVLPFY
jgi:hypothetical protein